MSSITSVTAAFYPETHTRQSVRGTSKSAGFVSQKENTPNLASSIMADGGLGFLRSRLEEKLTAMFVSDEKNGDQTEVSSAAQYYGADSYTSPEATANRIVGFALSMQDTYRRQNSGLSEKELMTGFEMEIRQGISDGFDHAKSVLGHLELTDDQTDENVASTWDRVQELLDEHFRQEV